MLVFEERGKPEYPDKNLSERSYTAPSPLLEEQNVNFSVLNKQQRKKQNTLTADNQPINPSTQNKHYN